MLGCSRCGRQRQKQPQEPNEVWDGRVCFKAWCWGNEPSLGAARPKEPPIQFVLGCGTLPGSFHLCHLLLGGEAAQWLMAHLCHGIPDLGSWQDLSVPPALSTPRLVCTDIVCLQNLEAMSKYCDNLTASSAPFPACSPRSESHANSVIGFVLFAEVWLSLPKGMVEILGFFSKGCFHATSHLSSNVLSFWNPWTQHLFSEVSTSQLSAELDRDVGDTSLSLWTRSWCLWSRRKGVLSSPLCQSCIPSQDLWPEHHSAHPRGWQLGHELLNHLLGGRQVWQSHGWLDMGSQGWESPWLPHGHTLSPPTSDWGSHEQDNPPAVTRGWWEPMGCFGVEKGKMSVTVHLCLTLSKQARLSWWFLGKWSVKVSATSTQESISIRSISSTIKSHQVFMPASPSPSLSLEIWVFDSEISEYFCRAGVWAANKTSSSENCLGSWNDDCINYHEVIIIPPAPWGAVVKQRQINHGSKSGQLLPYVDGSSSKGCFPWLRLSLVTFSKWCCTQRNGDLMRTPVSGRAGPTELPAKGIFKFFSFFPKRAQNEADLMGNESVLSPSLGTCCVRCQGGSVRHQLPLPGLVPGPWAVPDIPPQQRCLHSLVKERKSFQSEIKAPYLGEGKKKEANQPHSGSLLRNILDLILAHQGWQKSLISSHAGNEFYMCVRKREFGPHLSYPSCFSYLRPWSIPPYLSPLFRAFHKTQCP